eukprot:6921617-Prymnesium_polylepis.1
MPQRKAAGPLPAYLSWLEAQGVRFNGVRIDCAASTGALSIVSVRPLKDGEPLVVVPKRAVLSVSNASNDAVEMLLDEAALDKKDGLHESAVQTLVVAYEKSRGDASLWHAYFASMQEQPDAVILWDEAELELLLGTGCDTAAREWRAKLASEHEAMTALLREAGQQLGAPAVAMAALPLSAYVHAAVLMASRGFYVCSAHGDALVPGADAANHKCAL